MHTKPSLALCLLATALSLAAQTPAKTLEHPISKEGFTFVPFKAGDESTAAKEDAARLLGLFKSRRSVRAYRPTPVPKEHILQILDAARTAPTSGNQQPWKFLVVQDRARLDQLREAQVDFRAPGSDTGAEKERRERVRKNTSQYLDAPVLIVVLTDSTSEYPDYNHWDGPNAATTLMLAARALGYGTVFVTDALNFGVVRKTLAIPDQYDIVCVTPLGVPVKWPESPEKKPLESFVVFESFGK